MTFALRRFIHRLLMLLGIAFIFPAQAAYVITTINYPDPHTVSTQFWGINDSGKVVGQALLDLGPPALQRVTFTYDVASGSFTVLAPVAGADDTGFLGINAAGVMVGSVNSGGIETGLIRSTNGANSFFQHPAPLNNTEGRAIGTSGLVTGLVYGSSGQPFGIIYDPAHHTFIDIAIPNQNRSIAQGINGANQVVGSVNMPPGGIYPGSPRGNYGFLRESSGSIRLFRVDNVSTSARGINDSGRIAGFVALPPDNFNSAFVATLVGSPGVEIVGVPPAELLDAHGAVNTVAQAIDSAGAVVGYWDDGNQYVFYGSDPFALSNGFIARLIVTNKDQCKNSGWLSLARANGTFFKNQGDCIQYVNTGK